MSDYPAPNNYQIENTWWAERFVTLGKNNAIVGSRFITGGTQVWKLAYVDGYATFQGVSLQGDGNYINVDQDRHVLVYSETPGKFQLQGQGDTFIVKPVFEDQSHGLAPPVGWQLQSRDDGSPVNATSTAVEGAVWKFST